MDRDLKRYKVAAVAVVLLMVLSSFGLVQGVSDDSDATSSDSWACRITVTGTSLETEYSKGGGDFVSTTAVKGFGSDMTEGFWGYDEDGYGPFGSFYAAFDPNNGNEMVCHLDPYDLTQSVDKESIAGKGYNIMWCLPKIYISVSGSTITLASDDSHGGELAPAFTLKDENGVSTSYNYFALGVYEATCDQSSRLGSVSGTSPQNATALSDYRDEAKANEMVEGSVVQLWNFHQYQLYRLCSLAVMENFDSQGQVGWGNCSNNAWPGVSRTGTMDGSGPYFGTAGQNDNGVKLFIENSWGSLWEYVDDAVWWSDTDGGGLWAGQNVHPKYEWKDDGDKTYYTSGKVLVYPYHFYGYGTDPSLGKDCWGLPTTASGIWSTTAPDYIYGAVSGGALLMGGFWPNDDRAGLSYLVGVCGGYAGYNYGSRLAFLFAADSAAKLSVKYMDDGTQMKSDVVQKGQAYTIVDSMSTKEGSTFVGWSDGTGVYHPGDSITVEKSITLTAVWGHTVTFDLKGGTWEHGDTVAAQEGTYTAPSTVPTKNGCTFKEWRCGNDAVLPGGTVDLGSDMTLQAVWISDFVPIMPDDGDDAIEFVVDEKDGTGSGIDGKSILLIAIIVAIIAELAVLAVSRKR